MPNNNYYQNYGQQPYYGPPQQPYYGPPQQPYYSPQPPAPKRKKKRGGCLSTLLILAALIAAGIYLYPKISSAIPPEIRAYIEQFTGKLKGGLDSLKPVSTHPETIAGITFDLDDGFSVADQYPLDNGANVVLTPIDGGSGTEMLNLIVLPGILDGSKDIPSGQLSALLESSVRKLADVVVKTYGLDPDYPVTFDESKVFPIAYATFDGEDDNGNPFYCHAETALVDGKTVIGSCSLAGSERMLSRMVNIYENVVEGARSH